MAPHSDYKDKLRECLRERIQQSGLDVKDVDNVCELPKGTVNRILKKRAGCQISTLIKIAKGLECSVDYLLGLEPTLGSIEGKNLKDSISRLFSHSIFGRRMDEQVGTKREVARYVVKHFISTFGPPPPLQAQRIILDSGSAPTFVATEILRAVKEREVKHPLDILTTNLMAVLFFKDACHSESWLEDRIFCSLIGGVLSLRYAAIVGREAADTIGGLQGQWDLSIMSPSGLHYQTGLYAFDWRQYESKKAMLKKARTPVIIADNTKIKKNPQNFQRPCDLFAEVSKDFSWEEVQIVTNDGPYDDYEEFRNELPNNFYLA
jgi:DeoR/GlpR family transcriptional regulator of sugar metabolism